jgi:heme exporter protein B
MSPVSFLSLMRATYQREMLLQHRRTYSSLYAISFYLMLMTFFPLSVGTDPIMLRTMALGVMWLGMMLVVMLVMMHAFQTDQQEGVLEGLLFSALSLPLYVIIKTMVLWLRVILPLVLLTPLFGLLYGIPLEAGCMLAISLMLGSLSMSMIVVLGGSLTLALREQGLTLALMVLPLMIPCLIAGSGVMMSYWAGQSVLPSMSVLVGFFIISMSLCPFAAARGIRLSIGRA